MRDSVPCGEYALWEAEYERSPWGEVRDNFHAALVVRSNYAANGADPPDIIDLMYSVNAEDQSEEDMKKIAAVYKRRSDGN